MSVDGRLRNDLSRDGSAVDVDVDRSLVDVVRRGRRQRRLRRIGAVTILTAVIAVLAVLGPSVLDVLRSQRQKPVAPTPAAATAIEGTYAVKIRRADTAGVRALGLEGLWQFTLRGDGLVTAEGPARSSVSTPPKQYQLLGDQLLTTAFASDTCSGLGVYRWAREGSALSFTLVTDACAARVVLFTAHPWEPR
jgi:hypothetical protein